METAEKIQKKISRLGLGTVQFGFSYGINNVRGQVSYDEVLQILSYGVEHGVNFLDTSRLYGTSEEVLGKALEELHLKDTYVVCTKLDLPKGYTELNETQLTHEVLDCLHRSQDALRMDYIPAYLLHTADYRKVHDNLVWNLLLEQKANDFIGLLGVSIAHGPHEALECLADPTVRILQIPYNVFDQRWRKEGVFSKSMEQGITLVNRSSYLQGLALMDPELGAKRVPASAAYLPKLHALAKEWRLAVTELALRYVLSNNAIGCTILGVDSIDQFEENIALYQKGPLSAELVERIELLFMDAPQELLNPSLWGLPYPPPGAQKT